MDLSNIGCEDVKSNNELTRDMVQGSIKVINISDG